MTGRLPLRWLLRGAALLLAVAIATPHVHAWLRLRAARAAVAGHRPAEARAELAGCVRVWGWDGLASAHLLASRACRQDDDFAAAGRELLTAQRILGGATAETAFEWALLEAAGGNVPEVGEFLQRTAEQSPEVAPLVWEALAQGDLRVYRILDAMACVQVWLGREPDNPAALDLRGQAFVTGRGLTRGAVDYRRVLQLDPGRDKTRTRLAAALIDLGAYQEAADNLEVLLRKTPNEPKTTALLARCYYNLPGRRDEGRALLDASLARYPDDGLSLRTRGQIALIDDQKAAAEGWLRRAAAVSPQDYQTQWLLFEALRLQGKDGEARAQQAVTERVKDQATRLSGLQSRRLAETPLDPALHYEMGTLLTQTGRPEVGERWFLTALALDPDHRPSHVALAAYYASKGETDKAAFHREQAAGTAPPK